MSEQVEIDYLLTVNVEDASSNLKRIERLAFQVLGLFRRLGLPEEIDQGIMKIQRMIQIIRQLQVALMVLNASNPYTAALAVVGAIGMAASAADTYEGY